MAKKQAFNEQMESIQAYASLKVKDIIENAIKSGIVPLKAVQMLPAQGEIISTIMRQCYTSGAMDYCGAFHAPETCGIEQIDFRSLVHAVWLQMYAAAVKDTVAEDEQDIADAEAAKKGEVIPRGIIIPGKFKKDATNKKSDSD